jgi:hypothetical protein
MQPVSNFSKAMNITHTENKAVSYASADLTEGYQSRLALSFHACRGLNIPRLHELLENSAKESLVDTIILIFQLRDCRGGKGEKALGRSALGWLMQNYPNEFIKVLPTIPEYGRWDDLLHLFPRVFSGKNHGVELAQTAILDLFATQLKTDRKTMLEGKPISICAKWSPTEGSSMDKKYNVFRTLADHMGISGRVLRQKYNTPLRAYLKVVETFMCKKDWNSIEYSKVPSCAMKRLKKAFAKNDETRFELWKKKLEKGKVEVKAKQLQPHELVQELRIKGSADAVTEAQWKVLVEEVKKLGSLKDALVVVDTSSSMMSGNYGAKNEPVAVMPLDVAVALGMIISQVVQGPFHGHTITFNTNPKFCVIPDGTFEQRWRTVREMDWGGSTNLLATFQLILNRAKACKLPQEDMPKRLFIISDMQFNEVDRGQTNLEAISEEYRVNGYERPQIVFWNVTGRITDFPSCNESGTALLSGFSPALLKSILDGKEFSPVSILKTQLESDRYTNIRKALTPEAEEKDFVVV